MSETRKKVLIDLISGLLIVAFLVYINRNEGFSIVHLLHNGTFAAGVLLLGLGGLKQMRNKGIFDVIGYGFGTAMHNFLPWTRSEQNRLEGREERFEDYQERKQAERKAAADLLISGGIYMALSVALLVIYLLTEG